MALDELSLDDLGPATLWAALDTDTRRLAAQSMYKDKESRVEADMAVAQALRFRPQAVKGMPVARRVDYLLKAVRPDDGLASSLLISLHLGERLPILTTFLGELGIPNNDGVIDADYELEEMDRARLEPPVAALYEKFPADEVELYLTCLIAMDPDAWTELGGILTEKRAG